MKKAKLLAIPVLALMLFASCTSVKVLSDYDTEKDFNAYKSYAFYKTGIDKAHISDLDKKRILKAIEAEMSTRGFVKSDDPDLLVSIFTKEKDQVDIYNNFGWGGWGWGGWGWGGFGWGGWGPGFWGPGFWGAGAGGPMATTRTEGSLYIDLIDAKERELVWQGKGIGTLSNMGKMEKKEARIREFVSEILQEYPPNAVAAN